MSHLTNPEPTMSSRDMAELTEKRHDAVKRTIDTLAAKGVIQSPQIVDFKNANNVTGQEYLVGKRDSYIIVAQLSPEFTARLVDRWQELEHTVTAPLQDMHAALNDPSVLRRTLLTYTEKVIKLEGVVKTLTEEKEAAAPKLEQLERIARSDGSFCVRDAAKTLQVQEKKLKQLLIQEKWAYRRPTGSGLLAYADKIQSGLMEHKVANGEKSDGSEWTSTQARITPKGLVKLAELLAPMPPPITSHQSSLPLH